MIQEKCLMIFIIAFIVEVVIYLYNPHINYITLGDPDHTLILSPDAELREYFFVWREYNFGGGYGSISVGKGVIVLFFYILRRIFVIPEKLSFLIFLFGLLSVTGYGFCKFISKFILSSKYISEAYYPIIVSGLFYSFNLFSCITTAGNFYLLIPYILTPWILYYSFKYIIIKRLKYLIIVSFLISLYGIAPNPPTIIISLIIIVWTILTFKFINKWLPKNLLKKGTKIASLSFLLSFWWILPIIIYRIYFTHQLMKTLHMELFYSMISTLQNVFHLSGYWELFSVYYGMKVFYFSDILWKARTILIILSALIVFGAFIYYEITNNRRDKTILLSYFILFLFGLLLAQGYHSTSIIKDIYSYLITCLPFFGTFRNNYKWVAILAFCYSTFIPYSYLGYKNLLNKLTHKREVTKILPYSIIISFLLASSFPIWTGTLFNHYFKGIPKELYEVSDFLNNQIENDYAKVMIMPGTWLPYYKWAYYYTNRPIFISFIKDRSALVYRYGGEPPLSWYGKELVDDILYKRFFELNELALKNLGIKYVLIDKTLDTRLGKGLPTANIKRCEDYLNKKGFKLIYKGKNYLLYKLPNASSSVIWIPSKVYYISGNLTTNDKLILINTFNIKEIAVIVQNSSINKIDFIKKNGIYVIDVVNQNLKRSSYEALPWICKKDGISILQSNDRLDINLNLCKKYLIKIVRVEKEASLLNIESNNNKTEISNNSKVVNYQKINPTLWKVSVNATKPFMLSFAESYDPLWEARVYKNGKLVEKVKPVPLYGVINGFWISQTGDLQIVLRYKPQDWFELGLAISAMTFTLCIFYLIWDWRRSRSDRWALRLENVFRRALTFARK